MKAVGEKLEMAFLAGLGGALFLLMMAALLLRN